jgi:hypothetical protein
MQRRKARACIQWLRAMLQQQLHHGDVALCCCLMQRRGLAAAESMDVDAWLLQEQFCGHEAHGMCQHSTGQQDVLGVSKLASRWGTHHAMS